MAYYRGIASIDHEPGQHLRPPTVAPGGGGGHGAQRARRHSHRLRAGPAPLLGQGLRGPAGDAAAGPAAHRGRLLPDRAAGPSRRARRATLRGDRLDGGLHLVRGGDRGHRDGAAPPGAHGAGGHRVGGSRSRARGLYAGPLRAAHRARGHAAARPQRDPGRARARVRPRARRVRRDPDARGQHPGPDPDGATLDLHRGADRRER